MSEEYIEDSSSETYSSGPSVFWPLLILMIAINIFLGFQVYAQNLQRSATAAQLDNALTNLPAAQNVHEKYLALMKDVVETAQKNGPAANIVREAIQAGWISYQPKSGSGSTPSTNSAPAGK